MEAASQVIHSWVACSALSIELFTYLVAFQVIWITLFWALQFPFKNAGLIDFAWPSSFFIIAVVLFPLSEGYWLRKLFFFSQFYFTGLRFMVGWWMRTLRHGEDRRWALWRERWAQGKGWMAIRSSALNLFFFYHAQGIANVLSVVPLLALVGNNTTPYITINEWFGLVFWLVSFYLENLADTQLASFLVAKKKQQRSGVSKASEKMGNVCNVGLWRYSRHPNYFFEEMLWVAYAIFAITSANATKDIVLILSIIPVMYVFLVHFTGVPITEEGSVKHRGEEYLRYQRETSMFIPWFPKIEKSL